MEKFLKVSKEEVKNMLANLFMDELQGYELGSPQVKLLFSTSILDYVPGIIIEAAKGNEVKYLIYSPLQMNINIFDELPLAPQLEIGNTYHQGYLNADVIGEIGDANIVLSKENVESLCKDKSMAESLIKAYAAFAEISLQQDYFKIPGQEIFSCLINNEKYWLMQHRGTYAFFVKQKDSQVEYKSTKGLQITKIS